MKVVSKEQMQSIEKKATENYKMPSLLLMEAAGQNLYQRCIENIKGLNEARVLILAGVGGNGGDGFALARHLFTNNIDVEVIVTGNTEKIKDDALINFNIIKKMEVPIFELSDENLNLFVKSKLFFSNLIVDAMFGIGLNKNIEGINYELIKLINTSKKKVISIDIPSGVDSSTGKIHNIAIRANETVTLGYIKRGLILNPGHEYAGKIIHVNLTIPKQIINEENIETEIYLETEIPFLLPLRRQRSNKGSYGKVCVVAGCNEMSGAAFLCSKSAYRTGCGLVIGCFTNDVANAVEDKLIEVVNKIVPDKNGYFFDESFDFMKRELSISNVIILGPGIGNNDDTKKFVERVYLEVNNKIVLDADGINAISENLKLLLETKNETVITPHPLEMSRLTGMSVEDILKDTIKAASDFSKKYNVVTLLKDNRTIVASPNGEIYINTTGNNSMAKGGSGDVLTGIIAGFISQGLSCFEAAKLGAYIHGKAGEMASDELSLYGVIASDILDYVPYAINKYKNNKVV